MPNDVPMTKDEAMAYLTERGYSMPGAEARLTEFESEQKQIYPWSPRAAHQASDARLLDPADRYPWLRHMEKLERLTATVRKPDEPVQDEVDDEDQPIGTTTTLPVATWRLYNQGVPVQPKREEPRPDHYFQINPPLFGGPMSTADALAMAETERKRHAAQDAIVKDALQRIDAASPRFALRPPGVAAAMARLNRMLDLPKMAAVLHEADEKMAQIEREQQEGIQWGDPPPREGLDMAEVGKRLKALEAETFARINAPIPEDGSRDPAPVRRAPPVSVHAWPAPTED